MHLFGIGQGYKPYPTNDASACWKQLHIYKPYFPTFFPSGRKESFLYFPKYHINIGNSCFSYFPQCSLCMVVLLGISFSVGKYIFVVLSLLVKKGSADVDAFVWDRARL